MANSLFQKDRPESPPPTPYELIDHEIAHLKKGSSVRHGPGARKNASISLLALGLCGLAWLYAMDPILHAWYKGEAVRTYLYLHNYGTGPQVNDLIATRIFTQDEVQDMNRRNGSFQDYYASLDAANHQAQAIIDHMTAVRLLHDGKYQRLDPVGRARCLLFIRTGIVPPTDWNFLDPSVVN